MLQRLHTFRPEPRGCGGRLDHDKNQTRPRQSSCETRESVVQRTSARLRTGSTTSRLFPSNTVNKSHLINIATQPQLCWCLGQRSMARVAVGMRFDPRTNLPRIAGGRKWIVLAILVRVPWSKRPWALPVLVTLYQPEEQNQKAGRRHKTPSKLMRQMLAVLLSWFPERKFVFSGDRGYHRDSLGASSNADCQVQLREADSCPIESHARTKSKSQCEWQNHIRLHSAADHEYSGKNLRVPDWTFTFAKSRSAESAG